MLLEGNYRSFSSLDHSALRGNLEQEGNEHLFPAQQEHQYQWQKKRKRRRSYNPLREIQHFRNDWIALNTAISSYVIPTKLDPTHLVLQMVGTDRGHQHLHISMATHLCQVLYLPKQPDEEVQVHGHWRGKYERFEQTRLKDILTPTFLTNINTNSTYYSAVSFSKRCKEKEGKGWKPGEKLQKHYFHKIIQKHIIVAGNQSGY